MARGFGTLQTEDEAQRLLGQAAGLTSPFGGGGGPVGTPPAFAGGSTAVEFGRAPEPALPAAPKAPGIPPYTFPANIGAPSALEQAEGIGKGYGYKALGGMTLPRPFQDPLAAYSAGSAGLPLVPSEATLYNEFVTGFGPREGFGQNPFTGAVTYGSPTTVNAGVARNLGLQGAPEGGRFGIPFGLEGPAAGAALRQEFPGLVNKPNGGGFLGALSMGAGGLGILGTILSLAGLPEVGIPLQVAAGATSGSIGAAQGNVGQAVGGFGGAALSGLGALPTGDGGLTQEGLDAIAGFPGPQVTGNVPQPPPPGPTMTLPPGAFEELLGVPPGTVPPVPGSDLGGAGGFLGQLSAPDVARAALGVGSRLLTPTEGPAPTTDQGPGFQGASGGELPVGPTSAGPPVQGGAAAGGQTGASRAAGAGGPFEMPGTRPAATPEDLENQMRAQALSRFQAGMPMAPFGTVQV